MDDPNADYMKIVESLKEQFGKKWHLFTCPLSKTGI
jgi:hypothetical protein